MYCAYYAWQRFSIEKSKQHPWLWDLCFDGAPVKKGYSDPNEAAYEASKSDVGDATINSIIQKQYAPCDLSQWSQSRRNAFQTNTQNN